ncbi:MAG: four helix bundle protein [Syntrophothermus sp.]
MKVTNFENLDCWKISRELVHDVYNVTHHDKFNKDYGLKDQIQRASVSIMANIAEGFDSHSNKSFVHFLTYSYRSASEVQSLLYVALDLSYISQEDFNFIYQKSQRVHKLIAGLSRYLMNSADSPER